MKESDEFSLDKTKNGLQKSSPLIIYRTKNT